MGGEEYFFATGDPCSTRRSRMEKNVGGYDRIGRIVIGLLIALAGLAALAELWAVSIWVGVLALAIGAILLVTGATQQCPINEAAGIDTTEK